MTAATVPPRHPCKVTADRITEHLDVYGPRLVAFDRNLLSLARQILHSLAEDPR